MRNIIIFLFSAMLLGCGNEEESSLVKDLYINHYKSECHSFALTLCLQSRAEQTDDWSFFSGAIEGFEYEWGYRYKIKVAVENIDNPPEDSSSVKYTLLEIEEKVKEPTTSLFDISASRTSGLVTKISDNLYSLYADKTFTCITTECEAVDSLIAQDMAILFEFKHQPDPTGPLTLTKIKCSSSRESFNNSCTASPMEFTAISSGLQVGIADQQHQVIKNSTAYSELLSKTQLSDTAIPEIDFNQNMLVAIFTTLNSCYSVTVNAVNSTEQSIIITTQKSEVMPISVCNPVIGNQYIFIKLEKSNREISVRHGTDNNTPVTSEFMIKNQSGQQINSFIIGEEIHLEMTITNTTDQDIVYHATGPGHDFVISRDGEPVWSKYHNLSWAQVVSEHVLKASESVVLSATWSGINNQGNTIEPGQYSVQPTLLWFLNDGYTMPRPAAQTLQAYHQNGTNSPLTSEFLITDKFGQETVNNQFGIGEEIHFEVRITNPTDKDIVYDATGPGYDFIIKTGTNIIYNHPEPIHDFPIMTAGKLVWSKYHNYISIRDRWIFQIVIKASETVVLKATWNGVDNEGKAVKPGRYELHAEFTLATDGPAPKFDAEDINMVIH